MLASSQVSNLHAFTGNPECHGPAMSQNGLCQSPQGQERNNKASHDTHSESSAGSPVDYSTSGNLCSLAIDCTPRDCTPRDLTINTKQSNKQQLTKGNSNAASDSTASDFKSSSPVSDDAEVDADSDLLELKCTHCGCLFATEQMLKMHILDMHSSKHRISLGTEADAVNGLLSLNQEPNVSSIRPADRYNGLGKMGHLGHEYPTSLEMLSKELEGETPVNGKVFNPEAYCELCQKEFCNKYYLATHRATKHGQTSNVDTSKIGSLGLPTMVSSYGGLLPPSLPMPGSGGVVDADLRCPMCNMSFPNQFLLQGHVITVHSPAASLSLGSGLNPFQAMYTAQLMGGLGGTPSLPPPVAQDNGVSALLQRMKMMATMGMQVGPSPMPAAPFGMARPTFEMPFSDLQQNGTNGPEPGPEPDQNKAEQFSLMSSGMSIPSSGSNGWDTMAGCTSPSGTAKEAYCEYCDKTFCNKYFLKTHKMKKHGIGSSPCTESDGMRMFPYPSMVSSESVIKSTDSLVNSVQSTLNPQSYLEALMTGAMKNENDVAQTSPTDSGLASDGSSAGDAKIPKLEANADRGSVEDQEQITGTNSRLHAQLNATVPTAASILPCNLCSKNFSSVFALVAHKYRDHNGVGMDGSPSGFGGLTGSLTAGIPGILPPFAPPSMMNYGTRTPQKENDPMMAEGRSPAPGGVTDPEAYCEMCKKEFCSKYFLRTHKMNIHGIAMENTPPGCSTSLPSIMNTSATPDKSMYKSMTPLGVSPSLGKNKSRYSVGKNFCDVCNKEVCNKYFLRTHMLKMHGIVIDENKTVIGNINTLDREKSGALVFRCDVCSKEFSTRHLLKAHKQTAHGLSSSPSTPSLQGVKDTPPYSSFINGPPNVTVTPNNDRAYPMYSDRGALTNLLNNANSDSENNELATLVCKTCDQRFTNTQLLNLHMMSEHDTMVYKEEANYNEDIDTDTIAKEDTARQTLQCEFCSSSFEEVPDLQLHLITLHVNEIQAKAVKLAEQASIGPLDPECISNVLQHQKDMLENSASQNGLHQTDPNESPNIITEQSPPMIIKQNNGTKLYRCSYCHYYTKWRSNLSVHERRHTYGENKSAKIDKPHVCDVCMRTYRYAHSLERHKNVHRLSAMGAKWANSPEKQASKQARLHSSPEKNSKRFRCTKCEKVFRSRELCRSHLFAVHRRPGQSPTKSPNKMMTTPDRSVSEVVEDIHQSINESQDMEEVDDWSKYAVGYSNPLPGDLRPYVLQAFAMQATDGPNKDNYLESIVYLPVKQRLSQSQNITFTLTPAKPQGGDVITV